jgi:hypothetical protein
MIFQPLGAYRKRVNQIGPKTLYVSAQAYREDVATLLLRVKMLKEGATTEPRGSRGAPPGEAGHADALDLAVWRMRNFARLLLHNRQLREDLTFVLDALTYSRQWVPGAFKKL